MTDLERHKSALKAAVSTLRETGLQNAYLTQQVERAIEGALNPPAEMEDVHVVKWMCAGCGTTYTDSPNAFNCCDTDGNGQSPVKLTGTFTRPKPQPVERSVTGSVTWVREGKIGVYPVNSGVFPDFIKWDSLADKTGTLTFTWHE